MKSLKTVLIWITEKHLDKLFSKQRFWMDFVLKGNVSIIQDLLKKKKTVFMF